MKRLATFSLTALAFLLLAPAVTAATPVERRDDVLQARRVLQAKVEAMEWYRAEEAVNLKFSLHNPSSESVWVLRWHLPSQDMDANLLQVTRDGVVVGYEGPLVKRATPTAADYVEIKAGQTYTAVFDPTAAYGMQGEGRYAVTYRVPQLSFRATAPEAMDPALEQSYAALPSAQRPALDTEPQGRADVRVTAGATFYFEGLPAHMAFQQPEMTIIGGYNKCTTSQQSSLSTAHNNAISISGKAINQLTANPNGSSLYTYWFGTYNSSRFSTVKAHYNAANSAFRNKSVVYDCNCSKSAYAYVYPTQPYRIYLCKAFWSAPSLGRDSKAGTLVHEMTHFNVVASTDDYVYGASGAHNLALSNPAQAIDNADNHEYFAEDQP